MSPWYSQLLSEWSEEASLDVPPQRRVSNDHVGLFLAALSLSSEEALVDDLHVVAVVIVQLNTWATLYAVTVVKNNYPFLMRGGKHESFTFSASRLVEVV
jgi:hypothetical protein